MIPANSNKKSKKQSLWLFITALVFLIVPFAFLISGAQLYLIQRAGGYNNPGFKLDLDVLHFFTKESIRRSIQKLTTSDLPENTELPSFYIYTGKHDLEALDSDLPDSGKNRYISGHLKVDRPELSTKIQLRYRGSLPLHWLYDKKSIRVKLPPYTTYIGERKFNLVNPSTIFTVTDWISYDMAKQVGLLSPDYFPVRLFINNKYNGLHYFLSQVDESLLRKNQRIPGSIYSGDNIYIPSPFADGDDSGRASNFVAEDGTALLWHDQRLWEKNASKNKESKSSRADIKKFIEIVNTDDPQEFMREFNRYFDKEKYYAFWGLDTLVGTIHHDNYHNHKLYFDPYKGTFEPIEWDIRYWSGNASKDLPVNQLLRQVILNPILEYERDSVAYRFIQKFSPEWVRDKISQTGEMLEEELKADPFRQTVDFPYQEFGQGKAIPFDLKEYRNAILILQKTYSTRHRNLTQAYEFSFGFYKIVGGGEEFTLSIAVYGNSPIKFNPWKLVPQHLRDSTKVLRWRDNRGTPVSANIDEILFPGRIIVERSTADLTDRKKLLAHGKDRLVPAALVYSYRVSGLNPDYLLNIPLKAVNAITGSAVVMQSTEELPENSETDSVHPWDLPSAKQPEVINLSGEIVVTEDQIYEKHQLVNIAPGTSFKFAQGRSIMFYGKVFASGSKTYPILFVPQNPGENWGSIVLQGEQASGSRLQHIRVSGGSITSHGLIDYPGQLNIHDVNDFQLDDCTIDNNQIGDDALHIAYSQGEVTNCLFENTAFDALDIDVSRVNVSSSRFVNIGNDALDLMTSEVSIDRVDIQGAGDKCVSVGEASSAKITRSKLFNCEIGIAVKDESDSYIEDVRFYGNRDSSIALYRKNPRYSRGGTIRGNNLFGLDVTDIKQGPYSVNLIPGDAYSSTLTARHKK